MTADNTDNTDNTEETLAMARLSRVEVFAHDEIAVVHMMARTTRRCFLFGTDAIIGKC